MFVKHLGSRAAFGASFCDLSSSLWRDFGGETQA
jgi:hypothetical protein